MKIVYKQATVVLLFIFLFGCSLTMHYLYTMQYNNPLIQGIILNPHHFGWGVSKNAANIICQNKFSLEYFALYYNIY